MQIALLAYQDKNWQKALNRCQALLEQNPNQVAALRLMGDCFQQLEQFEGALLAYETALNIEPEDSATLNNLGSLLITLGHLEEGQWAFQKALNAAPNYVAAWFNLGNALQKQNRLEAAKEAYETALQFEPNHAAAHYNLALALEDLKKPLEAVAHYDEVLKLNPKKLEVHLARLHQHLQACEWKTLESELKAVKKVLRTSPQTELSAFCALSLPTFTRADHKKATVQFSNRVHADFREDAKANPIHQLKILPRIAKRRIRIGYMGGDFREHACASLLTECLEAHDRTTFETFIYSYGSNDGSIMRQRFEKSVEHFIETAHLSVRETAERIAEDQIDILVDISGHTQFGRAGVFCYRPAPIQINWIGYPGSMGMKEVDYILGDALVTPLAHQPDYLEKILQLPDSYQPNDTKRIVADIPKKSTENLPEKGLIFCCFNQHYKITPDLFAIWCSVLKRCPDSVLWLLEGSGKQALQKNAKKEGIHPSRLIFAEKKPHDQHLARIALADLVLDTFYYNAHTTTSDALWMGVPVVTLLGETFPARVAASLLSAGGIPQLITHSQTAYFDKIIELAKDHKQRTELKLSLLKRDSALFNTLHFVNGLETLYKQILQHSPNPLV